MKNILFLLLLLPFLLGAGATRVSKTEELRQNLEKMAQELVAMQESAARMQKEIDALRQVIRIAPSGVQIRSDHSLQILAPGPLDLKGKVIRLNGGDRPIAVVGSKISAPPLSGTGLVTEGSPTILAK